MKHLFSEMFPMWPITHLHFSMFYSCEAGEEENKQAFKLFLFLLITTLQCSETHSRTSIGFLENHEFYYIFPHFLCSLFGLEINNSNIPEKPKNRMTIQCLGKKAQVHNLCMIFYKRKISTKVNFFFFLSISHERMNGRWKMNCVMNFILWLLQPTFHPIFWHLEDITQFISYITLETFSRHHEKAILLQWII